MSTTTESPESTAARVALWRATHVRNDPAPHVLADDLALRLLDPDEGWQGRPDLDPGFTRGLRAAVVARARFVEDLVAETGTPQYVLLGAGLDTFAQRHPDAGQRLRVFEVDQPGPQAWKRRRLDELGYGVPDWLRLVPVDFEAGASWWEQVRDNGFDASSPALVASTGVSMYLTKDAVAATLRQVAALAPGSVLAMTFLLPAELVDEPDRPALEIAIKGARAAGTPFLSFYTPAEILAAAKEAGFASAEHVSGAQLAERYFAGRADGLRPSSGEDFLVART